MSYPCIDPDHFDVDGSGFLSPQPFTQWRHVAVATANSVQATYNANGGNQAADLLSFQVQWTNPDPISMSVYALLTRGGATVKTGARTRAFIDTFYGITSGAAPADPTTSTQSGRFGSGLNGGFVNYLGTDYARWATTEVRQAEHSYLVDGFTTVAPTETIKVRVRLRWDAAFWETLPYLISGSAEAELSVMTGASRLDLYAIPIL